MQRAAVGLRTGNGKYKILKFSDCLLGCLAKGVNSTFVDFSLENDTLILSENEEGYELRHSPECPIKVLSNSGSVEASKSDEKSCIGIATSVVIESSDSHILLTKRSPQLRSSPNVWVFPGGHLEQGETIWEAGIREVKEETGLELVEEKSDILGLWENVYPLLVGLGTPKYHILVIYLHTQLNETFEELTKKIIPNPEEVKSYCWLNSSIITKLFSSDETATIEGKQYVYEDGKIVQRDLDYAKMFNKWLWQQGQPYSGVNFALRKWMNKINSKEKSKF